MTLHSSVIFFVGLTFAISGAGAYSQQLGAYYSGLGMDTLGAGGVNCLFLAFFDPSKMTAADCNFSDPQTPCGEKFVSIPSARPRTRVETLKISPRQSRRHPVGAVRA